MESVDVALIIVYGFVAAYFLRRFVLFRKWPSVAIAFLPLGWVVLAVEDPLEVRFHGWLSLIKMLGLCLGFLLILTVVQADTSEKK